PEMTEGAMEAGPDHLRFHVLPMTTFTQNGGSSTSDIVIVKYLALAPFTRATLIARVHAVSGSTWKVAVQNVSYSVEEPATGFIYTTSDTRANLTTVNPNLVVLNFSGAISDRFRVIVVTPATTPASLTVSVDIMARR